MKILITRPVSLGALGSYAPGDTPDLPDVLAHELVALRKASRNVTPQPAPAETAAAEPVRETAAATPVVKRTRVRAPAK